MRHKIISTLLIFLLLAFVGSGYTQTMKKTGVSGASILKVAVGAKATGLAGATTTITGEVEQAFWNPAGIATDPGQTQVSFNYNDWLLDLDHNAFAVSHTFGSLGTFAISGLMSGVDGIEANRDIQAGLEGVNYETSETFGYNSMVIGLTWARKFTNKLSLGVTGKYYREEIDNASIGTVALDFGAIYALGYKDLAIGARIQHLGGSMEYYYVPIDLPLVFSFGTSMTVINSDDFKAKLFLDATKPLDTDQQIVAAVDVKLFGIASVRTGYKFNFQGESDTFEPRLINYPYDDAWVSQWYNTKSADRTDEGFSLGAGVNIPIGDYELVLDYAWTSFNLMDDTNRFSLNFKF